MDLLRPNQRVRAQFYSADCVVGQFLGGGGQGEVYRATVGGAPVALKWYFPHTATTEQRDALATLIKSGPPNERFLWPEDLAIADGVPGFGYLMPLRGPEYVSIVALMRGRVQPTMRTLATAGLQLANSYLQLHSKGLCYRDISFGNMFFNPKNGDVLICDNDNVQINGAGGKGVLGTPRFMAPEIVRGKAVPNTETDLFSLAVLLFYMFMVHHPLEGVQETAIRCFDLPAQQRLYGDNPVFVFDPDNHTNRPDPQHHQVVLERWPLYPKFLQDLFIKSFTEGLRDPTHGRVRESVWRSAMVKLRDAIVYGPTGAENFYCEDYLQAQGKLRPCWLTGQNIAPPHRLRIGRHVIVLNHDTKIYPHHVDDSQTWNFERPVAEVVRHPVRTDIWGLKNLSASKWVATASPTEVKDVDPCRSVTIVAGTQISFGSAEGRILL